MRSSLLILTACLIWALDILVRYPLTIKISFIHIVFIESSLGLLFALPWLLTKGRAELKKLTTTDWFFVMFLGGFGMTVAGFLSTESILEASPGTFSFLQIFQPFFVVYAAYLFLKEEIDYLYFYWGLWVVLSAVLMYSQDLELLISSDLSLAPGAIMISLATMLIWGLCTIAGKKLLATQKPFTVVALRWFFAFIFSSAFLVMDKGPIDTTFLFEVDNLWRFIFFSVISGTISMYLYYQGMKDLPAAKISFLELCYPTLGIMFSAFYTFEKITLLQTIGLTSFFAFIFLMLGKSGSLFDRKNLFDV